MFAVVVTHNGERWVKTCLDSLVVQEGLDGIVVVDNGSTDSTVRLVRQDFPVSCLIELPENLGFGRGNNIGIQEALDAGAEYIGLFNQDLIVDPDAIRVLRQKMEENPDYGLLSALQLNYSGERLDRLFQRNLPADFWDDLVLVQAKDVYSTRFLPAASVVARRQVLHDVGGFDPLFFLYSEDIDWCHRIRQAGWKLGIVPAARVRHWHTSAQPNEEESTDMNRWYGRALRSIKMSPRSVPVALMGLTWRWLIPQLKPRFAYRARAILKCIRVARQVGRNRDSIPHSFRFNTKPD